MKPRTLHITEAPTSLKPPESVDLPVEVHAALGRIDRVEQPEQGRCNLLQILHTESGSYVLKAARGRYRVRELWAEHAAMELLHGSAVPVPRSLLFVEMGDEAVQLRELVGGTPLKHVLRGAERRDGLMAMARTLAAIHLLPGPGGWTWSDWTDGALAAAERNMRAGAIDLEEDFPDDPPEAVLAWLHANRPAPGAVTLLHGDYRPKNLLWEAGRISGVIDWAFADYGDPYYDLGIAVAYTAPGAEREQFLRDYGLQSPDWERLLWCERLATFINV
ncbi:MAG TPA: aminoglycoside phosphotransferase family protein [Symbiobacteriaceae bacterium]|nr:aminoglycoside phosphotransferase family protein [Symbiobacteriaceae bacterium]